MASYTCKSNEIPASFGPITKYMITLVAMESLGLFSSTLTFHTICKRAHVECMIPHNTPFFSSLSQIYHCNIVV